MFVLKITFLALPAGPAPRRLAHFDLVLPLTYAKTQARPGAGGITRAPLPGPDASTACYDTSLDAPSARGARPIRKDTTFRGYRTDLHTH